MGASETLERAKNEEKKRVGIGFSFAPIFRSPPLSESLEQAIQMKALSCCAVYYAGQYNKQYHREVLLNSFI